MTIQKDTGTPPPHARLDYHAPVPDPPTHNPPPHRLPPPADAANLGMVEVACLDHDQLRILLLDGKNQVVGNILRYQGTVNSSVLRVAEVFRPAITNNCPGIIVCHNPPSGDPVPS